MQVAVAGARPPFGRESAAQGAATSMSKPPSCPAWPGLLWQRLPAHLLQDGQRRRLAAHALPPLALHQRHLQRVGAAAQRLALPAQHSVLLLQAGRPPQACEVVRGWGSAAPELLGGLVDIGCTRHLAPATSPSAGPPAPAPPAAAAAAPRWPPPPPRSTAACPAPRCAAQPRRGAPAPPAHAPHPTTPISS